MPPGRTRSRMSSTIISPLSISQSPVAADARITGSNPAARATSSTACVCRNPGGRNTAGRTPTAKRTASSACASSRAMVRRVTVSSRTCRIVWLPSSCPSSHMRCSVRSRPAIASPMTKKVALAPAGPRMSRMGSVHSLGPSSNVSATTCSSSSSRQRTVAAGTSVPRMRLAILAARCSTLRRASQHADELHIRCGTVGGI